MNSDRSETSFRNAGGSPTSYGKSKIFMAIWFHTNSILWRFVWFQIPINKLNSKSHLIFNSYLIQIHYFSWDRGVAVTHPTANPKVRGSSPGAGHFFTILKQLWEFVIILWKKYGNLIPYKFHNMAIWNLTNSIIWRICMESNSYKPG